MAERYKAEGSAILDSGFHIGDFISPQHAQRIAAAMNAKQAPPAAVVPDEVAMAYGYLWHAMEPGDFPAGACVAIPPSEAAGLARIELCKLLPMAERKEAITRARAMLAAAERAQGVAND
jgi:hypothetical protein